MADTDFGLAPLPVAAGMDTFDLQLGPRDVLGVKNWKWKGEQELELIYGKGVEPIKYRLGKIKRDGSFEVDQDEYALLVQAAAAYGGQLIKLPPIPCITKSRSEQFTITTRFFIKITSEEHDEGGEDEPTVPMNFTIVSQILVTAIS